MGDLVLVEWDDAWGAAAGSWLDGDAIPEAKPVLNRTVGWLRHRNNDGLLLVGTYGNSGLVGDVTFIPHGMVRNVEVVQR